MVLYVKRRLTRNVGQLESLSLLWTVQKIHAMMPRESNPLFQYLDSTDALDVRQSPLCRFSHLQLSRSSKAVDWSGLCYATGGAADQWRRLHVAFRDEISHCCSVALQVFILWSVILTDLASISMSGSQLMVQSCPRGLSIQGSLVTASCKHKAKAAGFYSCSHKYYIVRSSLENQREFATVHHHLSSQEWTCNGCGLPVTYSVPVSGKSSVEPVYLSPVDKNNWNYWTFKAMEKVMDDQLHFKWKTNLWNNYCQSIRGRLWNINGLLDLSIRTSQSSSYREEHKPRKWLSIYSQTNYWQAQNKMF